MTPTTVETRWGPVEAVYGECDCGHWGGEIESHMSNCASRSVVAYTRTRYVRCKCMAGYEHRPDPQDPHHVERSEPFGDECVDCERCSDSPLPGWVSEPCENMACEGGTMGLPGEIDGEPPEASLCECDECSGTGHVTETLSRERYREIVREALEFASGQEGALGGFDETKVRFALAIHKAGW